MYINSFNHFRDWKVSVIINRNIIHFIFQSIMQANQLQLRELIITDLQKSVGLKQIVQFLQTNKLLPKINKYSKFQDKIKIQFIDDKDAHSFYYQNCFISKIIARKFNIYYSFFDNKEDNMIMQYELNGNLQKNMRQIFQTCNLISKCRIRFSIKDTKFNFSKCILQLEQKCEQAQILNNLLQKLSQIQVNIHKLEDNQNQDNQFKCSIEIVNFKQIHIITKNKQQIKAMEKDLALLISKISPEPIKQIEIIPFQERHQQKSKCKVKAFFRFSNSQITMELFQKLRIFFLDDNQIDVRIYYFEHQANNFMTLFTTGLIKPVDIDCKHFEDLILNSFRNINAKIVQVIVKSGYGHLFTAKIYLADEESGKQLISNYNRNRQCIFRLYKDKSKISLNLFQQIANINQMKKIEANTQRILKRMRQAKIQDKQFTPIPLNQPLIYKPYHYAKTDTKQRYRQREGQYAGNSRKQSNHALERNFYLKEQQFPSI